MKNDLPLVSVYITNYNYERFIEQSLESVLGQSLQNWEMIIIDDGSTDNSKKIIERYRDDERVTIIYQQNKGLNITNNVAMRVARGKYIMRLDADDFLTPHALEKMSEALDADDSLGLIFPDYYYVDAEGHITGEEKRHNFEKEVSLYDQPAHGACTMIRLSFLKKIGGYNESFTCQDGYDLWLKFITHYSVRNITEPLFYYRRHGTNLTTNEERILETRRAIKHSFISREQYENTTLVIIPVRNTLIRGQSWPLYELNGHSIIQQKVKLSLEAHSTGMVCVVTDNDEVLSHVADVFRFDSRVRIIKRPASLAGPNQTLDATVEFTLERLESEQSEFEYLSLVTIDFPFADSELLDEAVTTLQLFGSDAVMSVRPDNKMYYQHNGHGLNPILDQQKFTRLEREALYKAAGGIVVCTMDSFRKERRMHQDRMSHVIVDELNSFVVDSEFSFEMFTYLIEKRFKQQAL